MNLSRTILILAVAGFCAASCGKSGNHDQSKSVIDIQGFALIDFSGNLLGWQGQPDSDWKFRPSLSAKEMALFQFNTGTTLDNTVQDSLPFNPIAFPNPAWMQQNVDVSAPDSNVVKIVIVDSMLTVLQQQAKKIKGGTLIHLDLSNATLFPDHSSRRIYFSFSALGKPDYKIGYGDIRICDQSGSACF